MPVLPHVRSISIRPAWTGDDPTVREVLGSRHRAGPAVKAGCRVVADTDVVGGSGAGVVTVGVGLVTALVDIPAALVGDTSSTLICAYSRTFPCMEANYHYAIKNHRGACKIPQVGGYFATRGFGCDKLVLYGIRLLA